MDTYTYPGEGLSLSQLVFALNKELKRTTHPLLMTSDEVSQLECDISTALAAARKLKNSFVHINRIPPEILSIIPTHLGSQKDVFRASFVCCHWRRAFLQHGVLWSQLFIRKGEDYVKTLLERAKGYALDVTIDYYAPLETIALLSPHAQKIERLRFPDNCWTDILTFSQVISRQLPLLRTLKIRTFRDDYDDDDDHIQRNMLTAPSSPLFSGSINLEEFDMNMDEELVGSLDHFVFPNLTTFNLTLFCPLYPFKASRLFNFLKASPTLRTVDVKIHGPITLGNIPQYMFIVLPNVETFSLYGTDNTRHLYESAMHISCPRAKYTSLTNHISNHELTHGLEIFPDPTSWNTIVHHYTTSPIEEVTLEIDGSRPKNTTACSLTFQSSDTTIIRLRSGVSHPRVTMSGLYYEGMNRKVLSQACQTIQDLPLLSHVKRLHIEDKTRTLGYVPHMAGPFGALFESLGPLDELTIHGCDFRMFPVPCVNLRGSQSFGRAFPHVQELTISEPLMVDKRWCVNGIEKLAESQHRLGKPFERVTVSAGGIPTAVAERLRQWVGVVDCHEP